MTGLDISQQHIPQPRKENVQILIPFMPVVTGVVIQTTTVSMNVNAAETVMDLAVVSIQFSRVYSIRFLDLVPQPVVIFGRNE